MSNKHYLYYSIIRYIPSVLKEESINIGIIGICPDLSITKYYTINDFKSKKTTHLGYKVNSDFFEIALNSFIENAINKNLKLDLTKLDPLKAGVFHINKIHTRRFSSQKNNKKEIETILKRIYEQYVEQIIPKDDTNIKYIHDKDLKFIIQKQLNSYVCQKKLRNIENIDDNFNNMIYEFQNGKRNIIGKLSLSFASVKEEYKTKISNVFTESQMLKNFRDEYKEARFHIIYAKPTSINTQSREKIDNMLNWSFKKHGIELIEHDKTNVLEEKIALASALD